MRRVRSFVVTLIRLVAELAVDVVGNRLLPALLVGAGIFLVAAGFYYLSPASAEPTGAPTDTDIAIATTPGTSIPPLTTGSPSPLPSVSTSPGPSSSATFQHGGVATRIVIPALQIDLPIVASPANEEFPLCNAAEYLTLDRVFAYPGSAQATYLYAHARTGMFLPLLTYSRQNGGHAMIGDSVEIYTDDDQRHVYLISDVLPHRPPTAATLTAALSTNADELWLQTSEGPLETSTKLQVVATPLGVLPATYADAHPTSHGRICPDAPRCPPKNPNGGGCRK